jgi:hypothetical protein
VTLQSSSVSRLPSAEVSAVDARGAETSNAVINLAWTIAGKAQLRSMQARLN